MPDVGRHRRIVLRIAEEDDLGLVDQVGWDEVDRQLAERRPERRLPIDNDVLVAHHDHFAPDHGVMDGVERGGVERPAQIDAADLGADEAVDRPNGISAMLPHIAGTAVGVATIPPLVAATTASPVALRNGLR